MQHHTLTQPTLYATLLATLACLKPPKNTTFTLTPCAMLSGRVNWSPTNLAGIGLFTVPTWKHGLTDQRNAQADHLKLPLDFLPVIGYDLFIDLNNIPGTVEAVRGWQTEKDSVMQTKFYHVPEKPTTKFSARSVSVADCLTADVRAALEAMVRPDGGETPLRVGMTPEEAHRQEELARKQREEAKRRAEEDFRRRHPVTPKLLTAGVLPVALLPANVPSSVKAAPVRLSNAFVGRLTPREFHAYQVATAAAAAYHERKLAKAA